MFKRGPKKKTENADGTMPLTGHLKELRNRLASVEKKLSKEPAKEKNRKGNVIKDLTILVSIASGAWVIVTLLNKLL